MWVARADPVAQVTRGPGVGEMPGEWAGRPPLPPDPRNDEFLEFLKDMCRAQAPSLAILDAIRAFQIGLRHTRPPARRQL